MDLTREAEKLRGRTTTQACATFVLAGLAIGLVLATPFKVGMGDVDAGSVVVAAQLSGFAATTQTPTPGSPGLVAVLFGLAHVSGDVSGALACWAKAAGPACASGLWPVRLAQILAAIGALLLCYRLAANLSRDPNVALLTVVLAFFALRLGALGAPISGEIWTLFALLCYFVLLTEAGARSRPLLALPAGAVAMLGTLFEPLAALIIPLSVVQLAVGPGSGARRWVATGGLIAGAALAYDTLAAASSALGYRGFEALMGQVELGLGERTGFVGLDRATWLESLILPVPVLGNLLAQVLPAGAVRRLGSLDDFGSLVREGAERFWAVHGNVGHGDLGGILRLAAAPYAEAPIATVWSLPTTLMRGLFAGSGLIGLIGLFHLRLAFAYARAEGRSAALWLVAGPALAMLALNTLLTANGPALNLGLPFLYAYAFAYVVKGW